MGRAYGLEGDHLQWALVEEDVLSATIDSKMAGLMAAPAPVKKGADATDSFFGEDDSLGAGMDGAFAGSAGAVAPPAARVPIAPVSANPASFANDEVRLAGLQSSRVGWWLVPVVVAVAVIAGILIARFM